MRIKGILTDSHCHLDGSLSLKTVKELAALQNIAIPTNEEELIDKLSVSDDCADLNEYLSKFEFPLSLLQTKEAITTAVYNLCEEFKEASMLYAEIRFAPQLHTLGGLSQTEVIEAAIIGLYKSYFDANLILSCMRGENNQKENLETVDLAAKFLGNGVCAVDLAGAEGLYPTANFKYLFEAINNYNLPFTVHCGEADGPESIASVLPYGPTRIGHGVRCIEDAALMKEISDRGIVLELCPTSNLNTKVFNDISEYPLKKLMDAGIKVTINTDNTAVSKTNIEEEFIKMIFNFKLDKKDVELLVLNSVEGSFSPNKEILAKKVNKFRF
jgi:adenosine deaminase